MGLRDRILGWLPRTLAADIEADSRRWVVDCPMCASRHSIWDLGGVRWKAAGEPRRLLRCPACGRTTMMRVRRVTSEPPAATDSED